MGWLQNFWRSISNNKLIQKVAQFFKWLASERSRWFWVLFFGILTIVVVLGFLGFPSRDKILNKLETMVDEGHAPWTLITIIIGAPTAFVIWAFRDHNNRMQIENQRKDINLKDFQKLSEWASGLHIPEKKITKTNTGKGEGSESSQTIETFERMEGILKDHPSLHDGAVALQIAAIYQLEAFLRGDYGNSFRRPAFQLIKSLWLALMQPHVDAWVEVEKKLDLTKKVSNENNDLDKEWNEKYLNPWRESVQKTIISPFGRSLNLVLGADSGKLLRDHAEDLPGSCFAGFNHGLSGIKTLQLEHLNLSGINFQGANLQKANLKEANLQGANLQGVNLQGANLQGANLEGANLQKVNLSGANLKWSILRGVNLVEANLVEANLVEANLVEANLKRSILQGVNLLEANLVEANLEGANLVEANLKRSILQGANLEGANLQGAGLLEADLQGAKLQGTYFQEVNLHGTILRNVIIDKGTNFNNSVTNKHTIIEVGEWRDGKFIRDEEKSKDLREQMIRQELTFVDD